MGHWKHYEVCAVHRPNQLDLRLCHLFHDALRLQCVEQSSIVSDWMVRRIPAYPDLDHPHHSHGEDSVFPKSSQHSTHHDNPHHCCNRNSPTVLLARQLFGFRPAAPNLLDCALSYSSKLCHPDAYREDVVHSTFRVELNSAGRVISRRGPAIPEHNRDEATYK